MDEHSFYEHILAIRIPWIFEHVEFNNQENTVYVNLSSDKQQAYACPNLGKSASLYDSRRIRELEKQLRLVEEEKEILKRLAALMESSFFYDKVLNCLSKTESGVTLSYGYNNKSFLSDITIGDATREFQYDANGNMIQKEDMFFGFNQANRLSSMTQGSTTASYLYNARGERVYKEVNGQKTYFVYDITGQLIAEASDSGVTKQYVYFNGMPLVQFSSGNTYFYHNSHLGTSEFMTNAGKSVVWEAQYTPFGKANVLSQIVTNNIRFPGLYFDAESGLHYNYFRDYDPETGRYIESDLIGLSGGLNTYSYGLQNPIYFIDPDGRIPLPLFTGAIGALAGGIGNLVGHLFTGDCIDWGNVAIAAGTGFVAGAAAPFVATSYAGAMALGATANVAQYAATQLSNGDPISAGGALINAGTAGALGGAVGGPVSRYSGLRWAENSPWLDSGVARSINNSLDVGANSGASNLARNLGAGVTSNIDPNDVDPTDGCDC
ncbi:RHS repeat-associated core domain-containing protein [Pleionea sediminis]|uniref:RHS repeat-associated core domain-containing protein n=1 Tax=Pleionea sediminis TaxID=2569479 RepID=UPI0011851C21|nr:RHS repeat-associated core domain-containing protein [Pleionea sediminis]